MRELFFYRLRNVISKSVRKINVETILEKKHAFEEVIPDNLRVSKMFVGTYC